MNKIFPLLIVVVVAAGAWFYFGGSAGNSGLSSDGNGTQVANGSSGNLNSTTGDGSGAAGERTGFVDEESEDDDIEIEDFDERPAAEIYKTSADALKAIKSGAKDYDDLILEQFTEPGADCNWCPEFYAEITNTMLNGDLTEDERSYYAEVLAISGRKENIQTLIQAVVDSGDSEKADIYAEALELTIGGDDVVGLLSNHLKSENEVLQEASVAAITNQGSRLAVETLYNHTVEAGDPDGYYSIGIGVAEIIPEEDSLPLLGQLARKKDQYSHLAVKALLNYGLDGLKDVMDLLSSIDDSAFAKKLMEDAIDHVNYEEEIEEYAKKTVATSKSKEVREFAKEILEDFDVDVEDLKEES